MLSRREQDTYDFIRHYIGERQQGPLLDEIASGLGIKSKGVVHRYVQSLAQAGLIDVIRGDTSLRRNLEGVTLQVGDRVVLRTQMTELLSLQRNKELKRVDQVSAVETRTVEVLITPGCKMVGRTLGQLRLRRRYGVYPLAVHRRNQNIGRQLDDVGRPLRALGARGFRATRLGRGQWLADQPCQSATLLCAGQYVLRNRCRGVRARDHRGAEAGRSARV